MPINVSIENMSIFIMLSEDRFKTSEVSYPDSKIAKYVEEIFNEVEKQQRNL